jgi:hypothetical protein
VEYVEHVEVRDAEGGGPVLARHHHHHHNVHG